MKKAEDGSRRGFTLVEVLVSLALVGVILPAVMAGVSLAMTLGDSGRRQGEAASLAAGELAEMVVTGDWQSASTEGDFGDERPGYSWELDVTDWDEPGVSRLDLTVRWTARGRDREVTMTTLAYAGSE